MTIIVNDISSITRVNSSKYLGIRKRFYHRGGLMMYIYHNNLLPCLISQLYAKSDNIHDHNNNNNNNLYLFHKYTYIEHIII